ncbi:hypothetical protein Pelo_6001 [Pelomyxa schiedti]|nr:hypothetical protein Pelo_6001 [Pelomyxa schiedti]
MTTAPEPDPLSPLVESASPSLSPSISPSLSPSLSPSPSPSPPSPLSNTPSPCAHPPLSPTLSPPVEEQQSASSRKRLAPADDAPAFQMLLRPRTPRQLQSSRETDVQIHSYNTRKRRTRKSTGDVSITNEENDFSKLDIGGRYKVKEELISEPSRPPVLPGIALSPPSSTTSTPTNIYASPTSTSVTPTATPTPTPSPTSPHSGVLCNDTSKGCTCEDAQCHEVQRKGRKKPITKRKTRSRQPVKEETSTKKLTKHKTTRKSSSDSASSSPLHESQMTHVKICMKIWNAQHYAHQQQLLQRILPLAQPYISLYAADPTVVSQLLKQQRQLIQKKACCPCRAMKPAEHAPQSEPPNSSGSHETPQPPQEPMGTTLPHLPQLASPFALGQFFNPTTSPPPHHASEMESAPKMCTQKSGGHLCSEQTHFPHPFPNFPTTDIPPEWTILPPPQLPPDDDKEDESKLDVQLPPLQQHPQPLESVATHPIGSED